MISLTNRDSRVRENSEVVIIYPEPWYFDVHFSLWESESMALGRRLTSPVDLESESGCIHNWVRNPKNGVLMGLNGDYRGSINQKNRDVSGYTLW